MVRPDFTFRAGVLVVVEGTGRAWADGVRPTSSGWTRLRFEAQDSLFLFGYCDRACQEKLNLFREDDA